MAASDRLYEICCECRDNEESLERLKRELELLLAVKRAVMELHDALDDAAAGGLVLPEQVRSAMHSVLVLAE